MQIKKIFIILSLTLFIFKANANMPKSTGKYKNWESFSAEIDGKKICFAQTIPTKRAPSSITRQSSRLFVTFRPNEEIKDEISITSGHLYKPSSVSAKSGKNNFAFFSQEKFAWLLDNKEEKSFIKFFSS